MPKFEEQKKHLERMVERDKGLQKARMAYKHMSRLESRLPEPLASFEWAYPIVSSSPYDAMRGLARALANKRELVNVNPLTVLKSIKGEDEDSKIARSLANEWETNLLWQMERMEKRTPALRSSIVWSSGLYHEIVGQLIHLPTQFKAAPIGKTRERAALRIGDWALKLVEPGETYIDYTDFMPERVAYVTVKPARQLIDFWGKSADAIQRRIDNEKAKADTLFVEVDFVDYDNRVVWAAEGRTVDDALNAKSVTLFGPEPWLTVAVGEDKGQPVPFLNWISVCGGLGIEDAPEHQRKPMLYPVWAAEQWATSNIMGTILTSLAVAEAAAPVNVVSGPGAENIEIDYTMPGGRVDLPNQFVTYQRIQRAGLDKAMGDMFGMFEAAMRRSTLADVLVTGQPVGTETNFAAYNLQVMQALASLGDFKMLAEDFLEKMYEKMLLMAHYTGQDIVGYGKDKKEYTINSEDIDPDAIYLSVELKPDVPASKLQRTAMAVQMAQSLPYAPQKILEQLDEPDPEGSLNLWKRWRLELADFEGYLKKVAMTASGEIQQLAAQMAQAMLQKQAQQPPAEGETGMTPGLGIAKGPQPNPNAPPGTPLKGPMFNPEGGGMPTAMAAPEATKEGQTGTSRGGQETQRGY